MCVIHPIETWHVRGDLVELMGRIGLGLSSLRQSVDSVAHSLMLTVLYAVIGIILLSEREFKYAREG